MTAATLSEKKKIFQAVDVMIANLRNFPQCCPDLLGKFCYGKVNHFVPLLGFQAVNITTFSKNLRVIKLLSFSSKTKRVTRELASSSFFWNQHHIWNWAAILFWIHAKGKWRNGVELYQCNQFKSVWCFKISSSDGPTEVQHEYTMYYLALKLYLF